MFCPDLPADLPLMSLLQTRPGLLLCLPEKSSKLQACCMLLLPLQGKRCFYDPGYLWFQIILRHAVSLLQIYTS